MRAAALALLLAGCAASEPPGAVIPPPACTIRPVAVTTRDLLIPATLAELRRVNAEIRNQCRGAS